MRNPIRDETDAFHLAFGGAALTAASVAIGALVNPIAGGTLFIGALTGALVWEVSSQDPDRRRPLREAAAEGRRAASSSEPRVLVVANRTLQGEELVARLRHRGNSELRIVTPILVSRMRYLASDVDKEIAAAHDRLAAALLWARSEGIQASGKVGDPNVALGAIEDELRLFAADEVLISTYPPGMSNWLETDIVERLQEELDIPVTHVIVEPDPAPVAMKR
jgi:GABA permease